MASEKLKEMLRKEVTTFMEQVLDDPDNSKLEEILNSKSIDIRLNSLDMLYLIERASSSDSIVPSESSNKDSLVLAGFYEGLLSGLDIGLHFGYLEGINMYANLLNNALDGIKDDIDKDVAKNPTSK